MLGVLVQAITRMAVRSVGSIGYFPDLFLLVKVPEHTASCSQDGICGSGRIGGHDSGRAFRKSGFGEEISPELRLWDILEG